MKILMKIWKFFVFENNISDIYVIKIVRHLGDRFKDQILSLSLSLSHYIYN